MERENAKERAVTRTGNARVGGVGMCAHVVWCEPAPVAVAEPEVGPADPGATGESCKRHYFCGACS